MIAHHEIRHACRARLKTLSVCTTGTMALEATTTGYARASGSFVDDGFAAGMEVTPAGFATNTVDVIEAVSALTLTVVTARAAESSASGRSLAVALPATRVWENKAPSQAIETGVPYVSEQYLGGAAVKATLGSTGEVEATPLYVIQFHARQNDGADALARYADAVIAHFKAGTTMATASGDTVRVRSDVAPTVSQLLPDGDRAVITVTIALRVRSALS